MSTQPTPPATFEAALAALEGHVARLERGDLELEEALRLFEEGVSLVRTCHEKLDAADARILALSGTPGDVRTNPLDGESDPG
jgi:exodeoxyribonuclease VII small subunit